MPNPHMFPDGALLLVSVAAQIALGALIARTRLVRGSRPLLAAVALVSAASIALYLAGYVTVSNRVASHFPALWVTWTQGAALILAMTVAGVCVAALVVLAAHRSPAASGAGPRRRMALQAACGALLATPVAATSFGILRRNQIGLNETSIEIPGLDPALDGLRIAQLSDIHMSAFLAESDLARAVDMMNGLRPHIALVTGDLITRLGDPLDACIAQIARLRADAGVLGCLGNHERYTRTENYVTARCARFGIGFLRMQARMVRFGGAAVNFAGVDYERMHSAYLIGAETLIAPAALNILLSHNPDVFPVAARQGYDLTIAGHTHGGQVNFEILDANVNIARFFTPYTRGLYWLDGCAAFVSSGIGTVGMPVRLGAPAEVNLLTLRAAGPRNLLTGARQASGQKASCGS